MKMLQEAMANLEKKAAVGGNAGNATENEASRKALEGDIDMECPSPAKIVRIFTSSTFTGKIC